MAFKEGAPIPGSLTNKELIDPRLSFLAARSAYSNGPELRFLPQKEVKENQVAEVPKQVANFTGRLRGGE